MNSVQVILFFLPEICRKVCRGRFFLRWSLKSSENDDRSEVVQKIVCSLRLESLEILSLEESRSQRRNIYEKSKFISYRRKSSNFDELCKLINRIFCSLSDWPKVKEHPVADKGEHLLLGSLKENFTFDFSFEKVRSIYPEIVRWKMKVDRSEDRHSRFSSLDLDRKLNEKRAVRWVLEFSSFLLVSH